MTDRQKAIDYRDAAAYVQACAEEGVEPELKDLHEQGLADLVFSEMQKSQRERNPKERGIPKKREEDIPRNYGIRRKDLEVLGYKTLEHIFYGTRNISIPDEMLKIMNPDEILAKYYSAGRMKRNNNHLLEPQPEDFVTLTREMDKKAYPAIGVMARDAKKRFSDMKGEQRARLDSLDQDVKQDFVASFHKQYIPSIRESMYHPQAFYDRNIDGKSREVYVTDICRFFEHKWKSPIKK
jgi:hypothetical protein